MDISYGWGFVPNSSGQTKILQDVVWFGFACQRVWCMRVCMMENFEPKFT